MKQEIQRLQDISKSADPNILAYSAKQEKIKTTLQEKVVEQLVPLLLKGKIDEKEYQYGQELIKLIQEQTKHFLLLHKEKEADYVKENAQYDGKIYISKPTFSNYDTLFNPTKEALDQEGARNIQEKLYQIVLKTLTLGKINKQKNTALIRRKHDQEYTPSDIQNQDSYQHNYLGATLEDLETMLDENHAAYQLEKEKKDALLKKFQIISDEWNRYVTLQNNIAHHLNKPPISRNVATFVEYLKTNDITIHIDGKKRAITFDDIKEIFLPFGATYFSDALWLDIISNNGTEPIYKRIQTYNAKMLEQAEDEEVNAIKVQFRTMFLQEEALKQGAGRYLQLLTYGLTKSSLMRMKEQYGIDLGQNPSEVVERFGRLEHITNNKEICADYLEAWCKNDWITLNGIVNAYPVTFTLPNGEEKRVISTPLLKKANEIKEAKKEKILQDIKTTNNRETTYTGGGKVEGAINGIKIEKEELIKKANSIFPEQEYSQKEYRIFRNTLGEDEKKIRPKKVEHLLHLFKINAGYYQPDLLQCLIQGNTAQVHSIMSDIEMKYRTLSEQPEHIKTLLVICHLLENDESSTFNMNISDLQISYYGNELDHEYGLGSRTQNNLGSMKKKYGNIKRWKSPQRVRANIIGKISSDYTAESLYHALFAKKQELLKKGFFKEEDIAKILKPEGLSYIRKPLSG